jgi:hypothetical protein
MQQDQFASFTVDNFLVVVDAWRIVPPELADAVDRRFAENKIV